MPIITLTKAIALAPHQAAHVAEHFPDNYNGLLDTVAMYSYEYEYDTEGDVLCYYHPDSQHRWCHSVEDHDNSGPVFSEIYVKNICPDGFSIYQHLRDTFPEDWR